MKNRHWTSQGVCTSSPKTRSEAILLFNFCFPPSPASRENENNSFLIFFLFLLVRNIFQQRGRFICERISFAFYYLLYYVVNSKVLLFANNYHLHCIRIWISFAFEYHNHLRIISIWISFAFEYLSHLNIIIVWKSFANNNLSHLNIISIWIS